MNEVRKNILETIQKRQETEKNQPQDTAMSHYFKSILDESNNLSKKKQYELRSIINGFLVEQMED